MRARPLQRHLNLQVRDIRLGLRNVRSLGNQIESVVAIIEENRLHIMVLTETWHEDADSVAIKRLRGSGLCVMEAAQQVSSVPLVRQRLTSLTTEGRQSSRVEMLTSAG